jgi:hypothetical protein
MDRSGIIRHMTEIRCGSHVHTATIAGLRDRALIALLIYSVHTRTRKARSASNGPKAEEGPPRFFGFSPGHGIYSFARISAALTINVEDYYPQGKCCWMLMALLFVGGIMNLAWIAGLALLVLAEKSLPWGRRVSLGTGVVLVAWGAITLATAA